MIIAKYKPEDTKDIIKHISKLVKQTFNINLSSTKDLENIPKIYIVFYTVKDKGKLIATAALKRTGKDTAEFSKIYIEKKYRRIGLGRKLAKRLIRKAKTEKIKQIKFYVYSHNPGAVAFYESLGFKKTRVYTKGKYPGRTFLELNL